MTAEERLNELKAIEAALGLATKCPKHRSSEVRLERYKFLKPIFEQIQALAGDVKDYLLIVLDRKNDSWLALKDCDPQQWLAAWLKEYADRHGPRRELEKWEKAEGLPALPGVSVAQSYAARHIRREILMAYPAAGFSRFAKTDFWFGWKKRLDAGERWEQINLVSVEGN